MATPTTAPSQADLAYDALSHLLISLEIPPGAPLVESDLMERIGVGRTPLRDAIHRLEMERLVVIHPRRGTFATGIDMGDLALVTDVRAELESLAAAQAAERATPAEQATLADLLDQVAVDGTSKQIDLDTRIHRAIHDAARNHFLAATAGMYHNLALRMWHVYMDRLVDITTHVEDHRSLLRAILDRDAETAAGIAREHVRRFERSVGRLI